MTRSSYRFLALIFGIFSLSFGPLVSSSWGDSRQEKKQKVDNLVGVILGERDALSEVPFRDVVDAASGKEVIPIQLTEEVDAYVVGCIGRVADQMLLDLGFIAHPIHEVGRINETSRFIEAYFCERLNAIDGLRCEFPQNASGKVQRAGYPDLRLEHIPSGRVFYLDPKVYKLGSEGSSFRTFYFEPRFERSKILDHASHLILGIGHDGRGAAGSWIFDSWQLVDLIDFKVRLKTEFQASNQELYRDDAVLIRGGAID